MRLATVLFFEATLSPVPGTRPSTLDAAGLPLQPCRIVETWTAQFSVARMSACSTILPIACRAPTRTACSPVLFLTPIGHMVAAALGAFDSSFGSGTN